MPAPKIVKIEIIVKLPSCLGNRGIGPNTCQFGVHSNLMSDSPFNTVRIDMELLFIDKFASIL